MFVQITTLVDVHGRIHLHAYSRKYDRLYNIVHHRGDVTRRPVLIGSSAALSAVGGGRVK